MSEQFTAAAKTAAAYFADLDYAKVDAGNSIQSVGGGFTLQSHLAKAFGGGDTKKKIGNFELLIGGEFSGDGGREVFAKALGCHSLHVRHMLRECGAPKHPFGFIEWDRAPAEVFAELAKRYSEPPDLRGADLSNEWNMLKTKISELDLRGANLSDSRFEESGFHNVDLTEANLSGSQFIGVQFWETDLTEADLSDCFFNGCTLMPGSKAPGANFRDTVAVGLGGGGRADFTGANFRNAIFCYAFLNGCNMRGADFRGANLKKASMREANCSGADFRKANLHGVGGCEVDFSKARMEKADLRAAQLAGADFGGARMAGADLRDSWLFEARLPEGYEREARCERASFKEGQYRVERRLAAQTA